MSNYDDLPLKERMKPFLLNEDMADIHFVVGVDPHKELIPGHKFLLATASEVFHGQLYGRFDVPEKIDVEDATPEAFKIVLGYIYTEEVHLTEENAFPVLYLAKKYMLNNLVVVVSKYVATTFTEKKALKVLNHLHLLDEEQAGGIWQNVEHYGSTILESTDFLELSQDALCEVLGRNLNSAELTVYEATDEWARAECGRRGLSFSERAREVLGSAIILVRFPLMTVQQFSNGPADCNWLTADEKLEIFQYFVSGKPTKFNSTPRTSQLLTCSRFDPSEYRGHRAPRDGWWNDASSTRTIRFSVDRAVNLHGIGVLGRKGESCKYTVKFALHLKDESPELARKNADVTTDASLDLYKVLLDEPVLLSPDAAYKITANIDGPHSLYGERGKTDVTCKHGDKRVQFIFNATHTAMHADWDVVSRGPIVDVYFSFA